MIDSKLFREDPQRLREACRLKGMEVDIEKGVMLEQRRRELIQEEETLQSERNRVSQEIGKRKQAGEDTAAAQEAMRGVNDRIRALAAERTKIEAELTALAMLIPNHPAPEVPRGASADENVEVARWGERPVFAFPPRPHWEICERLGLVDFGRGAKVAGSGFLFYRGWGARLERALFNFMLDVHTREHGYLEWFPPMLVNRAAMTGTGQLPKFENEMYGTDKGDDLFL
ncbi:MAG: serine--tRNA ligase, partial [Planctomycetota bacterium]|nr:serine--tRNA ligase [Planctomycetota bacterium]